MTELFENIFRAVQSCPVDRLPRVLGMLAEISETCRARLAVREHRHSSRMNC